MAELKLTDYLYLMPTPAGAYYSASAPQPEAGRRLLRGLLTHEESPQLANAQLKQWSGAADEATALDILYRLQKMGWVQGFEAPHTVPDEALDTLLPELLHPLSADGRALLADTQGFSLASQGFPHETAEELSALSADIASLHERHRGLLNHNLGLHTSAWALVDAAGSSQVGFWPLYIGQHRFVLVLGGIPRMSQMALTYLIWVLSKHYADTP